jgi:toxin ParE1/3/4
MKNSFHEAAEREFFTAIEYYKECQSGLEVRFSEEIYVTIDRISEHPYAWTKIDAKTMRCLTNKFPYGILYRISENEIQIIAVMHLHRKPSYWKDR